MVSRPPSLWQVREVSDWLRSLDLAQYAPQFEAIGIDGSLLLQITDEDLARDLGVSIRLHRVKLLTYIAQLKLAQTTSLSQATESDLNIDDVGDAVVFKSVHLATPHRTDLRCNFLTLKAVDGVLATQCFLVGPAGATVGRQTANCDVVIAESSISRRHCRIAYSERSNQFLLQDIGSTTGTFLMVRKPLPLRLGVMFQTGTTEFQVFNILFSPAGMMTALELLVFEGPNTDLTVSVHAGGLTIGRDQSNSYCVSDDPQMSAFHARIYLEDEHFYLMDVGSTNKTWLRLSPEGERSDLYPLVVGDVVKMGASVLVVQEPDLAQAQSLRGDKSSVCRNCGSREGQRYPCGHSRCSQCVEAFSSCPDCSQLAGELMRVYR